MLKSIIQASENCIRSAQLDRRAQPKLRVPEKAQCFYVRNSIVSRLYAEWRLWRTSKADDVVLCFHGLPPLFPRRGEVVVFAQNRLLFSPDLYNEFPFRVRIRLLIERWFMRARHKNCTQYVVQTYSMETAIKNYLGKTVNCAVFPFAHNFLSQGSSAITSRTKIQTRKYDFLYVANGDAHKNHKYLLEAWRLLATEGVRPSLALTISERMYPSLSAEIKRYTADYGLNIVSLGNVPWEDIASLYLSSSALIFPSKSESFGLPLVEAHQLGLPVLAPELDYVRDVVHPAETFCPNSPLSIARSVRRFLDKTEPIRHIYSAEEFMRKIIS